MALAALAAACFGASAHAKDAPKPSLTIDPVVVRNLLAPLDDARSPGAGYPLDPGLDPARGQRARLSLDVGGSTVFAITGRLDRKAGPPGPLEAGHAKTLGLRGGDSGKVYGGGINHKIGGVDLSATYQYSKIRAEQGSDDNRAIDGGPGKSHSLRATARIRFTP